MTEFDVAKARVFTGPQPGTRVIHVEIPADVHYGHNIRDCIESDACADDRKFHALHTAVANIAHSLYGDAFVHSHTIMEGTGKHGGQQ